MTPLPVSGRPAGPNSEGNRTGAPPQTRDEGAGELSGDGLLVAPQADALASAKAYWTTAPAQ
ncbi:hypothetical protein OHA71_49170 [Streptomyces sp. NBC_00444]|uniref:hypothetical protein n=1 Tax=Streptomyces sp. NBC_00444 TaxID=2975744 RepID=UPI002E1A5D0F